MSAATALSGEISDSWTDEVGSSDSLSSSGGRQPRLHASGSRPLSGKQTPSSERQDKPSELSDFTNNEEKFSRKWIGFLTGKETNCGRYRDHELQKEIPRVSNKELSALQSFCTLKIDLLHGRAHRKAAESSRGDQTQLRPAAEEPETDARERTVPEELLNRLYFTNTRAALKQLSAAEQHIPSQCPHCTRKRAELAQSAFLRHKTTLLTSALLQQKMDERLHTEDFLTLVGEAHKSLPRLSDDPRLIWKRLTEKSHLGRSGSEVR